MKKLLSTLALCAVILLSITSCGDDDAAREFGDAQHPTQQFINDLELTFVNTNDLPFSRGLIYEVIKEGRITKLCLQSPDADTYPVILWDMSDTTAIDGVNITADSGEYKCQDITDFQVLAGSRVAVSIVSDDVYLYEHPVNGIVIYPATYGDVTILAHGTFTQPMGIQFPNESFHDDIYIGVVDFVFEPLLD